MIKNKSKNNFKPKIKGFELLSNKIHNDDRGLFFETYKKKNFINKKHEFIQDNLSRSKKMF